MTIPAQEHLGSELKVVMEAKLVSIKGLTTGCSEQFSLLITQKWKAALC